MEGDEERYRKNELLNRNRKRQKKKKNSIKLVGRIGKIPSI